MEMRRTESVIGVVGAIILLILVLFCALSYFVYAALLKAAIAMLILGILFWLSLIIAMTIEIKKISLKKEKEVIRR